MELAAATLRTYRCALNKLESAGQLDFAGPNKTVQLNTTLPEYLTKSIVNTGSRKVYVSAVLNEIRNWPADQKKPYTDLALSLRKTTTQESLSQSLKEHRAENMLRWDDVLKLKFKAKTNLSQEDYLIYALYTLNAPVRADYVNMLVTRYYSKKHKEDLSRNYCVLHKESSYFVFNEYKTAKTYGQVIVPINEELFDLIKMQAKPGQLLLPSLQTKNALSKRVISIFTRLAEKKMGIGLLRHSFITTYLSSIHRICEKELVARSMMHSWVMQEQYHIITDDDDPI